MEILLEHFSHTSAILCAHGKSCILKHGTWNKQLLTNQLSNNGQRITNPTIHRLLRASGATRVTTITSCIVKHGFGGIKRSSEVWRVPVETAIIDFP